MVLVHSYNVLLKETQAKELGLLIDLEKNPNNERATKKLEEVRKQISWIQQRIKDGKDPGVRIQ
jgi:lipid II:glycine glycyltransferase (peptidoglycan interpeptide bridge formation enzyme)